MKIDLRVLPKYPWLDQVSIACERCGRNATWRSMGVTQWQGEQKRSGLPELRKHQIEHLGQ